MFDIVVLLFTYLVAAIIGLVEVALLGYFCAKIQISHFSIFTLHRFLIYYIFQYASKLTLQWRNFDVFV